MDEYLAFAIQMVRQGGDLILKNSRKQHDVETKSDNSPVTWVDKKINNQIIEAVKLAYPEHGVMGEEASHGTGKESYQWICDPLDGTKAFVIGVPLSTSILALAKDGILQLCVIYNPFKDELFHAVKGGGAFCNGQAIQVNKQSLKDGGTVLLSESGFKFAEPLLAKGYQIEPLPGAGYRAILLAQGRCSGIMQNQSSRYDITPASLLVTEAGGKATDLTGQPLPVGQPLENGVILSNGICHDDLLQISN